MQVTIHKDGSQILFDYTPEEKTRYIRIELDILRKLSFINSEPINPGCRKLSQTPVRFFTKEAIDTVVNILKGYCIEPNMV